MFGSVGQVGAASGASVPLLEGKTYKELVESIGFATKVAERLGREGVRVGPGNIRGSLQVDFRDPDLLRMRGMDKNPAMAIQVANAACQALVDLNRQELRAELEATVESVVTLMGEARVNLDRAVRELATNTQREGLLVVDFRSGSSELLHALDVLSQHELEQAKEVAALRAARERLKELKVQEGTPVATMTFPVEDPAVTTLRTQLETVRTKMWEARKYYTEANPAVRDLQTQVTELQRELDGRVREGRVAREFRPSPEHALAIGQKIVETNRDIISREAAIAARARMIQEQRRALGTVPGQRSEVERLKLAVSSADERYRALSKRLDDTRVALDAVQGTLSVVQAATAAEFPDWRRRVLISVALLLGLPLAVGLLLDYMDTTIHIPASFGRQLGLSCLATVPKTWHLRSARALQSLPGPSVEAVQVLRSGLRVASTEFTPRKIAVVASQHGVGRTTIVLHLARTLVREGKRVIVVDADFRSSTSLARRLRMEPKGGLMEVVTGERSLAEVLTRTPFGARLLPAKAARLAVPLNTQDLFRCSGFSRLSEELGAQADVVLFDTPPINEYADTLELLPHLDGVIFIIDGRENVADFERSVDMVRASGVRSLGVVFNKYQNGG
jgi:Mrp family chromosome partitioning ATPase/uncharacterized protein involved in exopolysaccharide biosynthesis